MQDFAALMARGEPAGGEPARAVAERHRHLTRWFYPVGTDMHRRLAQMYVEDPRFAANYDRVAPGLSGYVREAIAANADALDG